MQGDIFLKESMYCSWILTIHPHTQNIHFRFQSHSDENDATFSLAGIGNVNDNFCDIKDFFFFYFSFCKHVTSLQCKLFEFLFYYDLSKSCKAAAGCFDHS